ARNFGVTWLDPVAGSVVALFIIGTGVRLARESVSPLLGETASAEEIEKMKALTRAVEGVVNVHDLSVHKYGHFYFTAAHVELSDRLDPHKMHEISTVIELRILRLFPGQCVVHVDPIDLFHPLFHEVTDALRQVVIHEPRLVEFRDLNLWPGESGERGDVEVTVDPATPPASHPALAELVQRELRRRFPALELRVRLKVDFTATPLAR
ncbi:MAG: hypothetical protein HY423_15810, partial [Candidatus Lambdaproteobacteria bacterium]|nr:hypothetical protein [Candidatus Lambdaproteobacteria bacterium]